MNNLIKDELQNIISGKSKTRFGTNIQEITSYLKNGERASRDVESSKQNKKEETKNLENYISKKNLWIENLDFSQYVSEGAEQKVYLKDSLNVLKLNDSIYYNSWKDYFNNLLLHNFFFPDTLYTLVGFSKKDNVLYAVVQQPYITVSETTDLSKVKRFLNENGFVNNRNHDYINTTLGIILEDLHDENVLTNNKILYFIDTVFYLTDDFWN